MRGKQARKRELAPDYRYQSVLVSKFVNYIMEDGKKNTARRVVYAMLDEVKRRTKDDNPVAVFEAAVDNCSPLMEVRSRRIGGANYQVPREVRPERRLALALRWIHEAAYKKKGKPMYLRLADEIVAAQAGEGDAVKKKENVHKMAEANRAFAHFAF